MGGSEVLLTPKYCVVLLVDSRVESGVIPDIVNSDGAPAHEAGALRRGRSRKKRAFKELGNYWGGEKLAFQLRSSWAQFRRVLRFWRVAKSITYVFSTPLNVPTPPASKLLAILQSID